MKYLLKLLTAYAELLQSTTLRLTINPDSSGYVGDGVGSSPRRRLFDFETLEALKSELKSQVKSLKLLKKNYQKRQNK